MGGLIVERGSVGGTPYFFTRLTLCLVCFLPFLRGGNEKRIISQKNANSLALLGVTTRMHKHCTSMPLLKNAECTVPTTTSSHSNWRTLTDFTLLRFIVLCILNVGRILGLAWHSHGRRELLFSDSAENAHRGVLSYSTSFLGVSQVKPFSSPATRPKWPNLAVV